MIRGEFFKPLVVSSYHPYYKHHLDEEHWEFNGILDTLLSRAPNNTEITMGADVNCRIGRRGRKEYLSVLGINGFNGRNNRGENLLEIYGSNNLTVGNTLYTHENYTIYVSKGLDKTPSMHDIFAIAQTTHKQIWDCKAVNDGAESDHAAVAIKLAITSIKFKHNTVIKGGTDWMKIATAEGCAASYCETLKSLVDESTLYDNFNEFILKAGEQTAMIIKQKYEGWFQFIRETLSPLLEQRNELLHSLN